MAWTRKWISEKFFNPRIRKWQRGKVVFSRIKRADCRLCCPHLNHNVTIPYIMLKTMRQCPGIDFSNYYQQSLLQNNRSGAGCEYLFPPNHLKKIVKILSIENFNLEVDTVVYEIVMGGATLWCYYLSCQKSRCFSSLIFQC